jgi:hypothetical protein
MARQSGKPTEHISEPKRLPGPLHACGLPLCQSRRSAMAGSVLGPGWGTRGITRRSAWLRLSHNRNEQECSEKGVEEGCSRGSYGAHRAQLPLLKLHTRRRWRWRAEAAIFLCAALSKSTPRKEAGPTAEAGISPQVCRSAQSISKKTPVGSRLLISILCFFRKTPSFDR